MSHATTIAVDITDVYVLVRVKGSFVCVCVYIGICVYVLLILQIHAVCILVSPLVLFLQPQFDVQLLTDWVCIICVRVFVCVCV